MPRTLGLGRGLRDQDQVQLFGLDRLGLWDDLGSIFGVGCEHAVIAKHVKARRGISATSRPMKSSGSNKYDTQQVELDGSGSYDIGSISAYEGHIE